MYNGTCPVCMRSMHGFICPYCESARGVWSELESPDHGVWVSISVDDDVVDAVPSPSSRVPVGAEERTSDGQGEGIAISCRFENEVVPSLSSRPRLCTMSFYNPGVGRTLTVLMLSDGKEVLRMPVRVPKGSSDVDLHCSKKDLSTDFMSAFEITAMVQAGESVLFRQSAPVKVRPMFDMDILHISSEAPKWVTPHDRAIKALLVSGSPIIAAMRRNRDSSLKGYQGKNDDAVYDSVLRQMQGIYDGLSSMGFTYALDTFSFGNGLSQRYQRVKTPSRVLEDRTGVCIEFACLFASIFEAVDLHPILVFPPGHAMAGVVVSSKSMPMVKDRNMAGRKHVITMDMGADSCDGGGDTICAIFVETTDICSDWTFDKALEHAESRMAQDMGGILRARRYSVIYKWRDMHAVEPILSPGGDGVEDA